MPESRIKRWVSASHAIAWSYGVSQIGTSLLTIVQQLGFLDCRLRERDAMYVAAPIPTPTEAELLDSNEHVTLSYLWVLGAFELIRTLEEKHRKERTSPKELRRALKATLEFLSEIRVPLAKMVPDKRHWKCGWPVAFPVFVQGIGVGWRLSSTAWVSRHELGDAVLHCLEQVSRFYAVPHDEGPPTLKRALSSDRAAAVERRHSD